MNPIKESTNGTEPERVDPIAASGKTDACGASARADACSICASCASNVSSIQQLCQPAQLLLPPHIPENRDAPKRIEYLGLQLFYTLEYKRDPESGKKLDKITFSYREPAPSKRSRTGYGKKVMSKSYSPACDGPVFPGDEATESVAKATLNRVFFRFFLPALVEKKPELLTSFSVFALMGPYALTRLHKTLDTKVESKLDQAETMERLVELFGEWQLCDITPEKCTPIMLNALEQTRFRGAVRLLRQLFAGILTHYVADADAWQRYRMPKFGKTYSPRSRARKVFLNEPLDNSRCCEVISRAEEHIEDKKCGRLYLIAVLMLILGIDPAEACAVKGTSVFLLENYPDYAGLSIREILKKNGKKKTGRAPRERKPQHSLVPLDAADTLQARVLPVGQRLLALWNRYWETHPDHPGEYLLYNGKNKKRHMSPKELDDWLNATFGDIVPDRTFRLPTVEVKGKYRMSDYFAATAERVWATECALPEEGIRRLTGQNPLARHTDAHNYIDFQCESMLVNFAVSQDRWLAMLFGTHIEVGRSAKLSAVNGLPNRRLHARFIVEIPPQEAPTELRGAVEIPFAGSIHIAFRQNETPPPCL